MATHTHIGYRKHVGHVHCGSKLWGHRIPKSGQRHALNGGPEYFSTLCGTTVMAHLYDEFGFKYESGPTNVEKAGDDSPSITCGKCLKIIATMQKS